MTVPDFSGRQGFWKPAIRMLKHAVVFIAFFVGSISLWFWIVQRL